MASRQEVLTFSSGNAEFTEFIKENGRLRCGDAINYEATRANLKANEEEVVRKLGPLEPEIEEFEIVIPLPDGWSSRTIVTRPVSKSTDVSGPLIVLYYGGGFMFATPEQNVPYARGFARLFRATVVMPTFRDAPEHPFPVGPNDAWHALKWIAANSVSLKADPHKGFIVGGISSGANFAAVLSRRAIEENLQPPLTGQWVCLLVGFRAHTVPPQYSPLWVSWDQNADAMVVDKETGEQIFKQYRVDFEHPMFCPLANTRSGQAYVPSESTAAAFIQCAGADVTRDDGIVYHQALRDAGVRSKLDVYPGLPHNWWHVVPKLDSSKKMLIDIAKGFAWLLDQPVDEAEIPHKLWLPIE